MFQGETFIFQLQIDRPTVHWSNVIRDVLWRVGEVTRRECRDVCSDRIVIELERVSIHRCFDRFSPKRCSPMSIDAIYEYLHASTVEDFDILLNVQWTFYTRFLEFSIDVEISEKFAINSVKLVVEALIDPMDIRVRTLKMFIGRTTLLFAGLRRTNRCADQIRDNQGIP